MYYSWLRNTYINSFLLPTLPCLWAHHKHSTVIIHMKGLKNVVAVTHSITPLLLLRQHFQGTHSSPVSDVLSRDSASAAAGGDPRNNQHPWMGSGRWMTDYGQLNLFQMRSGSSKCEKIWKPTMLPSPLSYDILLIWKGSKKILVPEAHFVHPKSLHQDLFEVSNLLCIWKDIASILKILVLCNSVCIQKATTKNKHSKD